MSTLHFTYITTLANNLWTTPPPTTTTTSLRHRPHRRVKPNSDQMITHPRLQPNHEGDMYAIHLKFITTHANHLRANTTTTTTTGHHPHRGIKPNLDHMISHPRLQPTHEGDVHHPHGRLKPNCEARWSGFGIWADQCQGLCR